MSRALTFRAAATLVARREFGQRLRDRSFFISTAVTVGIIAVVALFPRFTDVGEDSFDVGLLGGDQALRSAVQQQADVAGVEVEFGDVADAEQARGAVTDGDLDAYVDGDSVYVERDLDDSLRAVLQNAYSQVQGSAALSEAGIDPEEVTAALNGATLGTVTLDPEAEERNTRGVVAFFGSMVLFGQLMGYSMWVAMGVVEEKSSRVVEVMLAAIPARALLAGKIVGIGLLGLVQLMVIGALGLALAGGLGMVTLTASMLTPVLLSLGWFVLGYAAYSCLSAAAAARISRQEELQNVTTPVTMLTMISYFASFLAFMSPDSPLVGVVSVLPPFSALVMPIRMARGDAAGWEVGLALGSMLLLIVLLVALAARIYEGAVLRMGAKVSWREALTPDRGTSTPAGK
ncbi:ABC-2 type transport system permease protein [Haloactinopolyspora alba]|uniref:ABC-2 type transport system permease protein n=1 Tax=Haloactinopolyspora alba TaxID=648780 RepID=A0A2P8E2L3_9ACTN|nr:ABC transporter permease [Haloactinopolyspora alba]PSL03718.1 ABC-2 type transport system permease protein [Haloactinopolyspora alba]